MRVFLFLLIFITILALTLLPYLLGVTQVFKDISLSSKNADWGAFGSYVGGVLGPILSIASILFVWWQGRGTAVAQQEQIEQIKKQVGLQQLEALERSYSFYMSRMLGILESEVIIKSTNTHGMDIWKIPDENFGDDAKPIKTKDLITLYTFNENDSWDSVNSSVRELMGVLISNIEVISSLLSNFDKFHESYQVTTYNHLVKDFENFISNTKNLRLVVDELKINLPNSTSESQ